MAVFLLVVCGAIGEMQMHFSESGGYPGAEMEEKSTCSAPVTLGLLAPES